MPDDPGEFQRLGVIAPVRVLSVDSCAELAGDLARKPPPDPAVWAKGQWINDRRLYEIATSAALRSLMRSILGSDVVLWGAELRSGVAPQSHRWQADSDTCRGEGGFASVWIGLRTSGRDSAPQLISHSHRVGSPLQQVAQEKGHGDVDAALALAWARERVPEAALIQPEVSDGEAIVFDDRLWRGGDICHASQLTLLLHYARADRAVRICDPGHPTGPVAEHDRPRAPVIAIVGQADDAVNWVVKLKAETAPTRARAIYDLPLPLADDPVVGWKAHPIFARATPVLDRVTCHAAVLSPGRFPHPPHRHDEEDLLVVLDGEVDLVLQDPDKPAELISLRAQRGAAMYFPSDCAHTIRNSSDRPATYVMVSWIKQGTTGPGAMKPAMLNALALPPIEAGVEFLARPIFEQPTRHLARFHCHVSDLIPGGISRPHVDDHDALIVLLSGRLSVLGQPMAPNGIAHIGAGELHGFVNDSDQVARYIVFEFHPPLRRRALREAARPPAAMD